MQRLHKLDVAAEYVELLKEVDSLQSECVLHLGTSDEAALAPYKRLQRLVACLSPLQEAAEGAAPHLLDHIARQVQQLRQTIQDSFAGDLEKTLGKMNWPKPLETVPMALQEEWSRNVRRLLDLQRQDLEDYEHNVGRQSSGSEPPPLLPLEVMVRPLEQRFTYHFSGNKPTNRLDKPEYFMSHTTDLISSYSGFLDNAVQPLLLQYFRGSDLAFTPAYIDANSAFITALLPMLKRKLLGFASQASKQPQLLSHLVHEVMSFDTTIQESFGYSPVSPSVPWRGLAYFLLDTCGYFEQWLAVERDFALSRYQSIVDSPESHELDYDSVASDATKPTKAAIRVNDLVDTITERYRTLSSFSQKLRFLIDIQIAIFDKFFERLRAGHEAFVVSSSAIGRRMQGVSKEGQTELQGVKGLDHLCRVFGSADYLEHAMRDWSDDVFFLELWEELQDRARNRERVSSNLGELEEIKQKTSAAVGDDENDGEVQGALFDETAASYRRLRVRSEGVIVETLTYNVREALRPYTRVSTWASLSATTAGGAISADLEPTLRLLADYLGFLSKAIGRIPLPRISRQLCHAVQTFLWDNVLVRHSFSTAGTTQLTTDMSALCSRIDRFVGQGQARLGLRRLLEGVTLISLPIRAEISREQSGMSGDQGEDEDDNAWDEAEGDDEPAEPKKMGLFEVERLVFMDNESARHALQQLGLELLNESEARAVLEKRIEVGS
jgi:RAD50-interacting protein 1